MRMNILQAGLDVRPSRGAQGQGQGQFITMDDVTRNGGSGSGRITGFTQGVQRALRSTTGNQNSTW